MKYPFSDTAIAIAACQDASLEKVEVAKACLNADSRFRIADVQIGDETSIRRSLLQSRFVVIVDADTICLQILRWSLQAECIPLVRFSKHLPADFPTDLMWTSPAEVVNKIMDIRRTPSELRRKIDDCKRLVSHLTDLRHEGQSGGTTAQLSGHCQYEEILNFARQLPVSNGGRFYQPTPSRIGLICDRFYYDSVHSAAEFIYLAPDDWEHKLEQIDVLLVVSTWNGLHNNEWQGAATEGTKKRKILHQIIDAAHGKGIPTVFYSKEDPPHYNDFLGTAKKCDYVFTTCAEKVAEYCKDCGHDRVAVLRFGIDPGFHNPVGCHYKKSKGALFSGSWYRKFPERCHDLEKIFYGVKLANRDLHIIDRFSEVSTPDGRYDYPQDFLRSVHPALDHTILQNLHKLFAWSININTVQDSQTMFANRAYELQAAGTLLLSNYSVGMNELLPLVNIVSCAEDSVRTITSIDGEELYERQMASVRYVMTGETCYDRISQLLSAIGKPKCQTERSIAVVADVVDTEVQRMFDAQSYKNRRLYGREEFTENDYGSFDIIAFWSHSSSYGMFYLEDMSNAFKYTNSDYVTKDAFVSAGRYIQGVEHDYVTNMADKSRSLFWRRSFDYRCLMEMDGCRKLANGYSIDHLNYDDTLGVGVQRAVMTTKPAISVVIPVYNNGWFLYGKAFASVLKCALFGRMEIVIVDDGSTDGKTPDLIRSLAQRYSNVKAYFFHSGGSGSASRPRNKGVEMSTGDYVLYLDPDDESVPSGVETLYAKAEEGDFDVVAGNYVIMGAHGQKRVGLYAAVHKRHPEDVVVDGGCELIRDLNFTAIRLQAMLVRRSLIVDNKFEQAVGAYGEDTLFSNVLLSHAHKICVLPDIVQVYYAAISNSAINLVDTSFMLKYRKGVVATVAWLKSCGLYDEFVSKRMNPYIHGWLFARVMKADPAVRLQCVKMLGETVGCFGAPDEQYDGDIQRFLFHCKGGAYSRAFDLIAKIQSVSDANWNMISIPKDQDLQGARIKTKRGLVRSRIDCRPYDILRITGTICVATDVPVIDKALVASALCIDEKGDVVRTNSYPWSDACHGEFVYAACEDGLINVNMLIRLPLGAAWLEVKFINWCVDGEMTVKSFSIES